MNRLLVFAVFLSLISCSNGGSRKAQDLRLWYKQPAGDWTEALPLGNGRLGAMVFGTVEKEHIQFNEETLWTGEPHDYSHSGAAAYLDTIRQLLFKGKQHQAEQLAMEHFMSVPLRQKAYQPFGDIYLEFPDHRGFKEYRRELDLTTAVCRTTYRVSGVTFNREVWISQPDQVLAIRIRASKSKALRFNVLMDSPHGQKELITKGNRQTMKVAVKNGVLHGTARIEVETDGDITSSDQTILVDGAREAVIYLAAATNYTNYHDVSGDPDARVEHYFTGIRNKSYTSMFRDHLTEYQSYFNRFHLDLGNYDRDTLPTDQRLYAFDKDTEDPGLVALYVQYGRYLLISSSRPGTYPANLQGIWNQSLHPPWDSKYTTNINTEMNYWPAEVMNLPDCQDPLFHLIEECAQTGAVTAKVHYNCDGWILHHNTDIWRGTAPINHSNHGMWVGGSGWLSSHLWEHFLFTRDTVFLRQRAWPIMREAARFYSEFLIPDPNTGWLISTPSNSPENGGMVAGPTMDHQIIRSLFRDCVEAGELLHTDPEFTAHLKELIPKIAPNQIGQYGQLQEWLEDKDNPRNHHRHVSHLWGVYPGADITWEKSPDVMKAARQSLIFRGDEGTGWSLAWKINFWARFLDGNHAYKLIKMLFRVKNAGGIHMNGGGSYINLFDAHPPFQIDGNFGAPAGIVELLIQSHQSAIDLLPALPDAFPDGSIQGVCARGGFVLSFDWKEGRLGKVKVLSKAGMHCKLRYHGIVKEFDTEKGKTYVVRWE